MSLRLVYLALALAGAVWTWWYNVAFMAAHQGAFEVGTFVSEAFSTPAGGSLSADIVIAGATGCVWMLSEARRLRMKHAWVYVVLGCLVAFAFAFPFFLFMRERQLQKLVAKAG